MKSGWRIFLVVLFLSFYFVSCSSRDESAKKAEADKNVSQAESV